ncbi:MULTISPECIES: heavy metal translocating P-type ATPase [Halobacteriales]|uniref:heavy metal translocating P-type ATPase n=1 Tax=Halobacteriales TaxID=2235 RepID=UPI000E23D17A|nr:MULTISPECIES: heavy metal translocating P-type ATPase [Halobacteria]RDZ32166.1 cadmium-translocating P-type ATPase [Haloferax sp. Atlit-24N]RLM33296.1 cadmium-translocating P-type ATPase [Haloferax sp. Atlit-109R]RLM40726.1 cadmium-translocating P-type ATPase [Haloferax sp. Atlit-105R]RLM62846.1 cadmium-translocating P-type ATPase [Halorubrum sp. Atlit-9R]
MAVTESPSLSTCTIHIERRGGRGDAGARALERHLRRLSGVHDVDVSFRTGDARITYEGSVISEETIRDAVRDRHVSIQDESETATDEVSTRSELRQEAVFVGLTLLGMAVGLVTGWLEGPQLLMWAGYGVAYVFGGWYGLKGAVETLRHRAVDIDLLMIVAALGALSIGAPFEGAMLLFLFSLSNTLQHYAIGRSRRAIKSLVEMRPDEAQVLRDGEEVTVPIDDVAVGDVFVVRPGDRIPLDGVVTSGEGTVDQASLTGESVPVPKEPGDEVFGGTINESGSLEIEVTRQAHESAISRLIHMVERAQSEKAPTQRLIDRLEQPYVLGVFGLTIAAIAIPLALGSEFTSTFYRAMTLMVAASPCAVIISTPAAVLSAIASGGRQGVLFKGGEHVEAAANIDAVAFDKTGTLTRGETQLTDVFVRDGLADESLTSDELLSLAASVQARSEHHLARATVSEAEARALDVPDARRFQSEAGKGVRADVDDGTIHIGNRSYVETVLEDAAIEGLDPGLDRLRTLEAEGKTSVLVAREHAGNATVLGWLAFTDTVRPGAAEMIEDLRSLGVEHIVMLTGDNERVAQQIADEVGIDEVQAELLPEEKVATIEDLVERYENVAMVGDGVNDAPALATATLGIAMGGAGTDVALETADVVLMGDDIGKIPYVLGLGRRTRRTLTVNLTIAFGAIALMVGTILLRGIPLPLAVVGHEGSTVLVSLNGLRLLGFRE